MTDGQLVMRARRGDREAFSVLASRSSGSLRRVLRRVVGDDETARDTAQEALLKAWLRLDSLREPEQFRPWVHRIAVNLCRDRARRGGGIRLVGLEGVEELADEAADLSLSVGAERRQAAAAVRRALLRLPLEQRTAIVLREYEGLTSVEIGEMTGAPPATVRSRIYHGLRAMRAMLPDLAPPGGAQPGGDA